MKLATQNIEGYYERLVRRAQRVAAKCDVDKACFELVSASMLAYNFNFRYADVRCDDVCRLIGDIALNGCKVDFMPKAERVVFFDAFSLDRRGLTQQYIRALMAKGIEFLYIFGGGKDQKQGCEIIAELEAYDKVTIAQIDQTLNCADKVRAIYNIVREFEPKKALLHIAPWSVEALAAFSQLNQVDKFNINLTDHAYWLGSSIFDFNIEFRDYGITVSLEKRGFKKEQLLLMPYYPITSDSQFQGFPEITNGKTVIFSGGAVYKVYGENGIFFDIVKRLLNENPDTVLLFAGGGNLKTFEKFIKKNNFEKRIVLIGNRRDINEVFKNADIYLGTYPIAGGLMSQFAAVNGLPILAYTDKKIACNKVEGIVCHNNDVKITYTNLDAFFEAGKRLCNDQQSRVEMGQELNKCVISVAQFNNEILHLINNNNSIRPAISIESIDYDAFEKIYIEVENKYQPQMQAYLMLRYKLKAFWLFPKLAFKAIIPVVKLIIKKITR